MFKSVQNFALGLQFFHIKYYFNIFFTCKGWGQAQGPPKYAHDNRPNNNDDYNGSYTGWAKKVNFKCSTHNFVKYWPIKKILSLL